MSEPDEQVEPVSPETVVDDDEQPDDDPEAPGETPDEQSGETPEQPQARQPSSEKLLRERDTRMGAENERHIKRIGDIYEDDAVDYLPCPLCFAGVMGFVLPGDAQTLSDEQRAAALAFLGAEQPTELNPAQGFRMCETCNGFGELANPTRVPHYLTRTCPDCQGNGFRANLTPVQPPQLAAVDAFTAAVTPNGEAPPCPTCGTPNAAGKPHFCNPAPAVVTS